MTPAPLGAHPSPEEVDALLDVDDATAPAGTGQVADGGVSHPGGVPAADVRAVDAEVAAHVRDCPRCAELLEGMRSVRELLRTRGREGLEPPADLDARLGAALSRAASERGGTIVPLRPSDRLADGRAGAGVAGGQRVPRWLTVAAGLAVIGGAGAAATQLLDGDPSGSQASLTQSDAGAGAAPESAVLVTASGTGYTEDELAGQVSALLDGAGADEGQSGASRGTETAEGGVDALARPDAATTDGGADGSTDAGTDAGARATGPGLRDPEVLSRCLDELGASAPPLAVDRGTWDGEAASVVVLPGGSPDTVQVWVVGPGCGVDGDDLEHFQLVTR